MRRLLVIGIGSLIMKDDGVGVRVAEAIRNDLKEDNIVSIVGETDFQCCLNQILPDDFLIIIDAMAQGRGAGTIEVIPLEDALKNREKLQTQHEFSLLDLIELHYPKMQGYFIGIEAAEVSYGFELSDALCACFDQICSEVSRCILRIKGGVEMKAYDMDNNFPLLDVAVCENCTKEFKTDGNKKYRYPFISCNDCGPRYSIIYNNPYDRQNTSMSKFEMCSKCAQEYKNPCDRRYNAQNNCCAECGPKLVLLNDQGDPVISSDPTNMAGELIYQGKILAVKGIGGYHLCCNAEDPAAVQRLRKLKNRPHKPLAIMARNIEAVYKVCELSEKEKEILTGNKKPILLLHKKEPENLPQNIAPNHKRLGVMLPYASLQFLLFPDGLDYLVMTSGNISGSPICYKNDDAIIYLRNVADYFLIHDREIVVPVDDAVVKVIDNQEMLVRCGRGYAPLTIPLESKYEILALGAEQKPSVCITKNNFAVVSQYIGDLNQYKTHQIFNQQIKHFNNLFNYNPEIYVHDLNPDYLSSRYAKQQEGQKITVQHHHAHMAGCMAENNLSSNAIGVIFDGTGLGTDGAIWGGEFFTGSLSQYTRVGHLRYVTLQGSDSVVKEPWKCAASYLFALGIEPKQYLPEIDTNSLSVVRAALENSIKCFESSSMGRLFDCVAALCGFQSKISYDAQAAIELENLIGVKINDFYNYRISETLNGLILEYDEIIRGVLSDIKNHQPKSLISTKFHNTLIEATAEFVSKIRANTGLQDVVLSGGVFENTYILERLVCKLRDLEFNVFYNRLTPTNDGGISFGQVASACSFLEEKKESDNVPCDPC